VELVRDEAECFAMGFLAPDRTLRPVFAVHHPLLIWHFAAPGAFTLSHFQSA
jgi:hypothetical protein